MSQAKIAHQPQPATTRERILDAAINRFAHHSYEDTGLRDIAEDVGIDVAYVHRSFGSKERLFAEAIRAATRIDLILGDSSVDLTESLSKQVLAGDDPTAPNRVGALDIAIRSLSSPAATSVLHEFILSDFIGPMSERLDQPGIQRATLAAAFLTGLGILKKVLKIEALNAPENPALEALITSVFERILHADSIGRV